MSEFMGRLRERVTLERWQGAPDGAGGSDGAWVAVAELWAAVEAAGFGPAVEADRVRRAARYRVTLRAGEAPTLDDRLRWDGQTLGLLAVERDPARPDRVTIEAEERA